MFVPQGIYAVKLTKSERKDRVRSFEVRIGENDVTGQSAQQLTGNAKCGQTSSETSNTDPTLLWLCQESLDGRFVTVQSHDEEPDHFLEIAELAIYATFPGTYFILLGALLCTASSLDLLSGFRNSASSFLKPELKLMLVPLHGC